MSPESEEHSKIKETVLENLRSKYGSGLKEYPDSGSINDVKVVTGDGISIFVENVWTSKKTNFDRDLNILLRSKDNVKILVVNPEILREGSLVPEDSENTDDRKGEGISGLTHDRRIKDT